MTRKGEGREDKLKVSAAPADDERARFAVECRPRAKAHSRTLETVLPGAAWSPAFTPTLTRLEALAPWVERHKRAAIIDPPSGLTAFELAAGRPLVFEHTSNQFASSLAEKARLFDSLVVPATQKLSTRMGYWSAWRSFVTFLAIDGEINQAMPASGIAIKAFAMHLIMLGYAGASVMRFFEAIIDRHRHYGYEMEVPVVTVRKWVEAIQKQLGLPKREKFFILPLHIRCILQLPRSSLKQLRDTSIMTMGTICALRAAEIGRIDVCDVLWDYDGPETVAIALWYRKNDGFKKGLHPRIGKGSTPATCPLILLREYMRRGELRKSAACTKGKWTRSPCEACGRFFRKTTAGGTRLEPSKAAWNLSKDLIGKAVKENLNRIGVDPGNYTAVSMRRGGVSAAVAGGVNETLWKLQSGHRGVSWQNYADIVKKDQLYQFFDAFGL
jgi:hypothetical protein